MCPWQCPDGRLPRCGLGQIWHLAAEALWALMHINEIGCYNIPTLTDLAKNGYSTTTVNTNNSVWMKPNAFWIYCVTVWHRRLNIVQLWHCAGSMCYQFIKPHNNFNRFHSETKPLKSKTQYRSGTVKSNSFVGKILLRNRWKYEQIPKYLNYIKLRFKGLNYNKVQTNTLN